MKHACLLIALCVMFGFSSTAQTTTTVEKNATRITITTKKTDENGKTITETYIAEGDDPSRILQEMAVDPGVIRKVEINEDVKAGEQERLFLFRSAGDNVEVEGLLDNNVIVTREIGDGENGEVEKVIIINKEHGKEGKECYKIFSHGGDFRHGAWGGHEKKGNCAALGVYVNNFGDEGGSRINSLIENGGAQAAGLKEGDVLTSIEEFEITDFATLHLALSHFLPGDKVTVRYNREGKARKVNVELKDWKDLPGHEWRSREDCGEPVEPATTEDNSLRDDPPGLSNIQPLELQDATIFPNPTEGVFAFSFRTTPGPLTVAITDVNGKTVYNESSENPDGYYQKEIDLRGFPQGNYVISVSQGDSIFTEQISKQ